MFDAIRDLVSKSREHWFADVSQPGFVSSASIDSAEYAQKKDYSHVLTFRFSEPVRDGNDISHLNLRNGDGKVVGQFDLVAGEAATELEFDPRRSSLDVVAVTTDGVARDTSTVDLYKESVNG